jgi:hypothetical protein
MDEKLTNNSGVNHYPSQVVAWVTDEVLELPIVARRFGREAVKSHYNFRSGTNTKTPNLQIYPHAMNEHVFIRETGLIAYLFRQFFLLKPHTIAFQMELIAHETPSALETLPGETPIVLWSQRTPSGTYDVILTVVSYFVLHLICLSNVSLDISSHS